MGPALEMLKQQQPDGSFLQYMPLPGEVAADSFVAPMASEAMRLLREARCVLADDRTWCTPRQVLNPGAPFLCSSSSTVSASGNGGGNYGQAWGRRVLIPGDWLHTLTGFRYVALQLALHERCSTVLQQLSVEKFSAVHLVQCLTHPTLIGLLSSSLSSNSSNDSGDDGKETRLQWFTDLYTILDAAHRQGLLTQQQWTLLATSAPVLLHDGRIVSAGSAAAAVAAAAAPSGVFVWPEHFSVEDLQLFQGRLAVLHPRLTSAIPAPARYRTVCY